MWASMPDQQPDSTCKLLRLGRRSEKVKKIAFHRLGEKQALLIMLPKLISSTDPELACRRQELEAQCGQSKDLWWDHCTTSFCLFLTEAVIPSGVSLKHCYFIYHWVWVEGLGGLWGHALHWEVMAFHAWSGGGDALSYTSLSTRQWRLYSETAAPANAAQHPLRPEPTTTRLMERTALNLVVVGSSPTVGAVLHQ